MASKKSKAKRQRVSARRTAEEATSGFKNTVFKLPEGVSYFNVKKEGIFRFEIISYEVPVGAGNPDAEDGNEYFQRTFFAHRFCVGPNNDTYICPARTIGQACPICEHRTELMQQNGDKKLIEKLVPKQRQLFNIFDHAEPEKGVQVWEFSYHLFGKMLYAVIKDSDEDDDYEYFADREDGLTLKVGFEEKTYVHKYYEARSIDFKVRKKPIPDEILDGGHILDPLLIIESYDTLKDLYFQTGPSTTATSDDDDPVDDDDDLVAEEEPKRRRGKAKLKKAADEGLAKGDDVVYEGEPHTIFKVSPDGTSLTLCDEDDDLVKGVAVADVEKVEEENPTSSEPDAEPNKEKPSTKKDKRGDSKDDSSNDDDEPAQADDDNNDDDDPDDWNDNDD